MRRHGRVASAKSRAIAIEAEKAIVISMWEARVIREARRGAVVVAGPSGEVLSVQTVALDGYGVHTVLTPFTVKNEVLRRKGTRWIEDDLSNLGDAPTKPKSHVERDRPDAAAPGQRTGHLNDRCEACFELSYMMTLKNDGIPTPVSCEKHAAKSYRRTNPS